MEKIVFISHSKLDKNIAQLICESLENKAIGCWIAPRDIPYGTEWAAEIANAIKQCKVFLFLFSKNSNVSRQCPKEVNIADNTGIPVLCVALDDIEMNPSLQYHLSNSQVMFVDAKKIKSNIDNISSSITDMLNSNINQTSKTVHFDKELERRFENLFGKRDVAKKDDGLSFVDILNKKLSENYVKELVDNNSKSGKTHNSSWSESDFDEYGDSIRPISYYNGRVSLEGLHFTIVDTKGKKTVIYRTVTNYDISTFSYYLTAERLDCIDEQIENDKTKRIFFVDIPNRETQLTIITFDSINEAIIVNSGILYAVQGVVKISSSPLVVKYDSLKKVNEKKAYLCDENSTYITLDPRTGEELPRIKKVDGFGNEQFYIEMESDKSYFTFQIRNKDSNSNRYPMEAEDVGDFFLHGIKGFPHNTYNALIWYEKAKTPTSYEKMSIIFSEDSIFADKELAEKYKRLSKETA